MTNSLTPAERAENASHVQVALSPDRKALVQAAVATILLACNRLSAAEVKTAMAVVAKIQSL